MVQFSILAVSGEHAYILMLFIASLKNRTPQMRESLRETDEQAAELAMEQMLSTASTTTSDSERNVPSTKPRPSG